MQNTTCFVAVFWSIEDSGDGDTGNNSYSSFNTDFTLYDHQESKEKPLIFDTSKNMGSIIILYYIELNLTHTICVWLPMGMKQLGWF